MKDYYDYCYECTGHGDDFYLNEDGEEICACDTCWVRLSENDDDDFGYTE